MLRWRTEENNLFDDGGDRQMLRHQENTGAGSGLDEFAEMLRHRPYIVGDENSAGFRSEGEDFRVRSPLEACLGDSLEIDARFAAGDRQDDRLIEILVRLEPEPHREGSRASASFL